MRQHIIRLVAVTTFRESSLVGWRAVIEKFRVGVYSDHSLLADVVLNFVGFISM